MNGASGIWITRALCIAIIALGAQISWAMVICLPETKGASGESIDIPIMIDRVDNLAGVKLVMEYDPKILSFQKGVRTSHTDSLMHVINDKKPGKLIIVMAGANGIKGKAFPLFILTFKIKDRVKTNMTTQPVLRDVELMTDQLKTIKCAIEIHPVKISPQAETQGTPQEVVQEK
jgi:hypothetical protein